MVFALIFIIVFFSFVLIKSADLIIISVRRIAKRVHTGVFAISALILALGTSLPELFVGVTSALEGEPNLALGVVIGSNIANISLVAGTAALLAGKVIVRGDYLRKDVSIALLAGVLPLILLLDGSLNRVDGLILIAVYAAYASSFFRERYEDIAEEHKKENFATRFFREFTHINGDITKEYGRLFIGIALLLLSADVIVKASQSIGTMMGISIFVIGLILIAIGTSLPELAFSIRSLKSHTPSMFFGNLLGSVIANSTLVIGITCLIAPMYIDKAGQYVIAGLTFVIVSILFWTFIKSKHILERWEAFVLVFVYFVFVLAELL